MRGRHRMPSVWRRTILRPPDNRVVGFSSIGAVVAVGAILAGISASSNTETAATAAATQQPASAPSSPQSDAPKPVSAPHETTTPRRGKATPKSDNAPAPPSRKPATRRPATQPSQPAMPDWMRRWYCYYNPCR
ncbi:hypothetical protein [Fodinicola acaciae]|uniref:hypothetical protein n=1 Tax=Fodinicola acaciae TaxID=2681555 RepID=UPI0013D6F7CC|nr:hypothetical protein [Fodinicola acaciae]